MTSRARKLVVAGLIVADDGRVLITRREDDQPLGGQWEFPGGKLEPGEAPTAGLARELREELDVEVTVGRAWDVLHHAYPEFDLLMIVYACRLAPGATPRLYSRQQLLDNVWGDHVYIEDRTVDIHIRRLRVALGPAAEQMVETVRGVGYKLVGRAESTQNAP